MRAKRSNIFQYSAFVIFQQNPWYWLVNGPKGRLHLIFLSNFLYPIIFLHLFGLHHSANVHLQPTNFFIFSPQFLLQFFITLAYQSQFFGYFSQFVLQLLMNCHFLLQQYNSNFHCKRLDNIKLISQQIKMKESYLSKYAKNTGKFLPALKSRNLKHPQAAIHRLKQPTQQSLMLDIQDIDQSLHNKNFNYRHGNLFSSEITDKLVTELHTCMKKQSIIMEDGFSLWNSEQSSKQPGHQTKRLTNKVQTLNERMTKLSMQNVYEYDLNKYMQLMKMNKNRWSLFKRAQHADPSIASIKSPSQISNSKLLEASALKKQNMKSLDSINQSFSNNTSSIKTNFHQKSKQSERTTLSPLSKLSKILDSHQNSRMKQSKEKPNFRRKVLTQISQLPNPEDEVPQISKYDIKNMLKKQGDHVIFIWLPPATYPQFNGMFTYTVTRKLTICRLKKYFFFRRSMNQRLFISIIEQISARENKYIEGIQIVTNKNDFTKVYEPIGWKMKSIEGMDKIRVRYSRDQH